MEILVDETKFILTFDPFESRKQPMMTIIGCLDVMMHQKGGAWPLSSIAPFLMSCGLFKKETK
ncbi:hypothetical protein [Acetobacterium woodii]|uniref:hypothetical protein n=1 Tax=Acetobacterium woodii TaxID=33952 RepID=UPI0002D97A69|nr:hypothetical protein [Acetobacterium woodii]